MTKRDALRILIESGSRDLRGQGLGMRCTTETWREKVREAIRKLFKDAYGYEMTSSDEFNFL